MSYGDPAYTLIRGGSTAPPASAVGANMFGTYGGLSTILAETVLIFLSADGANAYRIGPSATLTDGTGHRIPSSTSNVALPTMKAHEVKDFGVVNDTANANASVIWSIWRRYP